MICYVATCMLYYLGRGYFLSNETNNQLQLPVANDVQVPIFAAKARNRRLQILSVTDFQWQTKAWNICERTDRNSVNYFISKEMQEADADGALMRVITLRIHELDANQSASSLHRQTTRPPISVDATTRKLTSCRLDGKEEIASYVCAASKHGGRRPTVP